MTEHDPQDEDALDDIADRIGRGRMQPETPADISTPPAGSPPSLPRSLSAIAMSLKL